MSMTVERAWNERVYPFIVSLLGQSEIAKTPDNRWILYRTHEAKAKTPSLFASNSLYDAETLNEFGPWRAIHVNISGLRKKLDETETAFSHYRCDLDAEFHEAIVDLLLEECWEYFGTLRDADFVCLDRNGQWRSSEMDFAVNG